MSGTRSADFAVLRSVLKLLRAMDGKPHTRHDAAKVLGCSPRNAARILTSLHKMKLAKVADESPWRARAYEASVRVNPI